MIYCIFIAHVSIDAGVKISWSFETRFKFLHIFLAGRPRNADTVLVPGEDSFEPPCKTSASAHLKATGLGNVHVPNLESATTTFHHTEPSTLPLETNAVKKSSTTFDMYGKDQEKNVYIRK